MSDALSIRPTTLEDLDEVDALLARSYPILLKPHYKPSVLVGAVPLISKAQPRLLSSGTYYAVTSAEGRILGAGGWTRRPPPKQRGKAPDIGHIRHVVTDHRFTRRGVGRYLMQHILAEASDDGCRGLECLSTLTAVPFYGACGFAEVGPITVALAPGIDFPAVLMRRSFPE